MVVPFDLQVGCSDEMKGLFLNFCSTTDGIHSTKEVNISGLFTGA